MVVPCTYSFFHVNHYCQVFRACCPNPFLSLRTPTIKNCNGRGVAISLYSIFSTSRYIPLSNFVRLETIAIFSTSRYIPLSNFVRLETIAIFSTSRYTRYFQHLVILDIFNISLHSIFSTGVMTF